MELPDMKVKIWEVRKGIPIVVKIDDTFFIKIKECDLKKSVDKRPHKKYKEDKLPKFYKMVVMWLLESPSMVFTKELMLKNFQGMSVGLGDKVISQLITDKKISQLSGGRFRYDVIKDENNKVDSVEE